MNAPLHPGIDPRCNTCRGDGYVVHSNGDFARARACGCVGTCKHCKGTGFVATSAERRAPLKRCSCSVLAQRIELFDAVEIPARHAHSTRQSFEDTEAVQTQVKAEVSRYMANFRPGEENRGLVLYGDVGRGKTHLMAALLRDLVFRYGVSARFVEFSHLLADVKSGFDRGVGPGSLMDPLVRVDVLGIDELGKGRNTEFEGTVLDELVSRRYNAARTILATTNYWPIPATGRPAPNLAHPLPAALVDRVGERVFSRLEEMCDFVPVRGPDHRTEERRRR